MWYAVFQSGIHATLAGVLLAIIVPARPAFTPSQFGQRLGDLQGALREERDSDSLDDALGNHRMTSIAESVEQVANAVQSPLQRLEHSQNP